MYGLVRRVVSLLEREVTEINDNIYYGSFPHILLHNNRLYTFYEDEERQRGSVLHDWACPVGVPIGVEATNRGSKDSLAYVGYIIGTKIYVHRPRYEKYVGANTEFIIPTVKRVSDVTPPAWNGSLEELSRFIMKSAFLGSPDFLRQLLGVQLTSSCMVDKDALTRDGWIINQLYGRQAFVGIRNADIKDHRGITWSNRYLVNVCKNRGIEVAGMLLNGNMPHPHIDGNFKLCTNEWEGMFLTRLQRGDYTAMFYLLTDFLQAYSSDSPYFDLPVSEPSRLSGSKYFMKRIEVVYDEDDDRYEEEDYDDDWDEED